jgi:hypothetical protein
MDVLQVGILIIVLLIMQGVGLWFLFGRRREEKKDDSSGLMLLQQHVQDLAKTLDARMGESSRQSLVSRPS